MVYSDTISTYHDIKLLGFSADPKFFANASVNPDNGGFCTPAGKFFRIYEFIIYLKKNKINIGNCLPAGVLNLTVCLGGILLRKIKN